MHKIVPFAGHRRCVEFQHGPYRTIVTLDVGPRILHFAKNDGPNHMAVYEKDLGKSNDGEYHSYGGHRIWIAPELPSYTIQVDSKPCSWTDHGDTHWFSSELDENQIERRLIVTPSEHGLEVRSQLINHAEKSQKLCAWAITVMQPGGQCIFPLHPQVSHDEQVLPASPLVLWSYTDFSDPRLVLGKHTVRLKHEATRGSQKIGSFVEQGIAVHENFGESFVKQFLADPTKDYADFGCNFEAFTRQDMLEVESLGPFEVVPPGGVTETVEHWSIVDQTIPSTDFEAYQWLMKLRQ